MARNYNKLCKFGVSKFSQRDKKVYDGDDNVDGDGGEGKKHGIGSPRTPSYRSRNDVVHPRFGCVCLCLCV